jgi:hypothetical protein
MHHCTTKEQTITYVSSNSNWNALLSYYKSVVTSLEGRKYKGMLWNRIGTASQKRIIDKTPGRIWVKIELENSAFADEVSRHRKFCGLNVVSVQRPQTQRRISEHSFTSTTGAICM